MEKILVASTAAPHKVGEDQYWLADAEGWEIPDGYEIEWYLAREDYPGGDNNPKNALLDPLQERVEALGGRVERFTIDDGAATIDSGNRLIRICTGRNLAQNYACLHRIPWILFLDTDVTPPLDILPRLLELDYPFVGLNVPEYGLSGPIVEGYPPEWYVMEHYNTAGCWMMHHTIFGRGGWHWDPWNNLTDDPAMHRDLAAATGKAMRVRHFPHCKHVPALVAFEGRNIDRSTV